MALAFPKSFQDIADQGDSDFWLAPLRMGSVASGVLLSAPNVSPSWRILSWAGCHWRPISLLCCWHVFRDVLAICTMVVSLMTTVFSKLLWGTLSGQVAANAAEDGQSVSRKTLPQWQRR